MFVILMILSGFLLLFSYLLPISAAYAGTVHGVLLGVLVISMLLSAEEAVSERFHAPSPDNAPLPEDKE